MPFYSHLHFIRVGGVIASFPMARCSLLYAMNRNINSVNNGLQTGRSIGRAECPMVKPFGLDSRCSSSLSVRIRNLSATMRKSPPIGACLFVILRVCVRACERAPRPLRASLSYWSNFSIQAYPRSYIRIAWWANGPIFSSRFTETE